MTTKTGRVNLVFIGFEIRCITDYSCLTHALQAHGQVVQPLLKILWF